MHGYFCIGFIDFMLAGKKLTDYANLFSPHENRKVIPLEQLTKQTYLKKQNFD